MGEHVEIWVASGSDGVVRLRDADGRYLNATEITSLSFEGSTGASLPRQVTVPASEPTLTFDTRYDIEPRYDFGFVQVSTDGGATYRSLPGTTTTTDASPDTLPTIREGVPGYSGDSGGWITESVDLAGYTGQILQVVGAIVTVDDPEESLPLVYPRYNLTVNGSVQPGG